MKNPFTGPVSSRARNLAAALVLVFLGACNGCRGTDAERAARERAEIEQRIRDSSSLVLYRSLKLTMRAQGEPNAPEEIIGLWTALEQTRPLPAASPTAEEARLAARSYLDVGIAFYKAKHVLQHRDEDEFPLLWTQLTKEQSPLPGYDAGQEHAFLAVTAFLVDLADRSRRTPSTELIFYELARATPAPTWLPGIRSAVQAMRGLAFCQAGYHYAAEEELNAFVSENEATPEDAFLALPRLTRAQSRETTLATGYFLRAWNRRGLDRDRAAEDDLYRGLKSLEKLGVDNELTWWGWAYLHSRHEEYEASAKYLDRLAGSPYLGEQERAEMRTSAEDLRKHGERLPIFRQTRAALMLGQALVARAGGVEHILVTLMGPEKGKNVYAPLAWMDRVRQGVGELTTEKLAQEAGESLDKARALGGKGLDALKQRLERGTERTAESTPP
ncbi:hypothetical protein [Melittangium boletus]|uniref:hypothetical protein n=1 Tax=Melittangium boletus TaxID=83453 RepID=UPI003DA48BCA